MIRALAVIAAAALAGCVGSSTRPPNPTDVEARDGGVFVPSARISVNFVREPGTEPSHAQGGHGLELGMTRASGKDTQTTAAGDPPVIFGGRTFASPQQLRHEFDFAFFDLSYRWRRYFGAERAIGIETLGGIGHANLDFTVSSATQSAQESLDSTGLVGSVGFVWRFRPATSFQSRAALFVSGASNGVANAARFELFLVQALGRNVALRGGYAAWHAETDRDGPSQSNVKVKFGGPALGLDVMF